MTRRGGGRKAPPRSRRTVTEAFTANLARARKTRPQTHRRAARADHRAGGRTPRRPRARPRGGATESPDRDTDEPAGGPPPLDALADERGEHRDGILRRAGRRELPAKPEVEGMGGPSWPGDAGHARAIGLLCSGHVHTMKHDRGAPDRPPACPRGVCYGIRSRRPTSAQHTTRGPPRATAASAVAHAAGAHSGLSGPARQTPHADLSVGSSPGGPATRQIPDSSLAADQSPSWRSPTDTRDNPSRARGNARARPGSRPTDIRPPAAE
jgi:hypothetical protein